MVNSKYVTLTSHLSLLNTIFQPQRTLSFDNTELHKVLAIDSKNIDSQYLILSTLYPEDLMIFKIFIVVCKLLNYLIVELLN